MAGRKNGLKRAKCSGTWGTDSSCWLHGVGQAQLAPSPWDPHGTGGWMASCLLVTFEVFMQDFTRGILSCHLHRPSLPSPLPSGPAGERVSRINHTRKNQPRDHPARQQDFSPTSGRDEEQRSYFPSQTCLWAQQASAASLLHSAQLLLMGKCLYLNSSTPLQRWLKMRFKPRFIYILITSAITITLPLLRNCSAACRSLSS